MEDCEIPKLAWPSHLLPLLNASCKAAVASLPMEQKQDFENVLLSTKGIGTLVSNYFDGQINSGESVRAACTRLLRLANRYAPEDDSEVVRKKMVLEIILRALPADAADYVREKEPEELIQAADSASKFMKRTRIDEFRFCTSKPWTHGPESSFYKKN